MSNAIRPRRHCSSLSLLRSTHPHPSSGSLIAPSPGHVPSLHRTPLPFPHPGWLTVERTESSDSQETPPPTSRRDLSPDKMMRINHSIASGATLRRPWSLSCPHRRPLHFLAPSQSASLSRTQATAIPDAAINASTAAFKSAPRTCPSSARSVASLHRPAVKRTAAPAQQVTTTSLSFPRMLHSLPAGLSEDFATTQATEGESARSLVTHSSAGQAWTGRFANFRGSNARFPRSSSTSAATPASTSAEVPPFLDFRTNASREVLYTKCDEEADRWLNSSRTTMWALDAEWRPYVYPGKQGRMALIQLGDDKTVYLFHVIHMKKFPVALARILRDKRILKVGINIRNDGTKMLKDWGVGCASLVELGALYVQVADDLTSQRSVRSMASLTNELLGHSVEKTGPTRMGNWENKNLSALQLRYAANDAFVTYEVAEKIKELQQSRPPRDYEIELATIHSEGTKVVKVRGTLQERQDHPATPNDIIPQRSSRSTMTKSSNPATTASIREPSTRATIARTTITKKWRTAASTGGSSQAGTTPSSRLPSRPSPSLAIVAKSFPAKEDFGFFYKSRPDMIQTIHRGRQSVVTIIPPKFQKRHFSHLRPPFKRSEPPGDDDRAQHKRRTGDVYIPNQLIPESLENKDILERNQTVWQEAGGRDLSNEITDDDSGENDWYLQQNQALFESLGQSTFNADQDRLEKKKRLK